MEFEREMNKEIDRINRETDKMVGNQSSQKGGGLRNQLLLMEKKDGIEFYLDKNSIEKRKDGTIDVVTLSHTEFPRYENSNSTTYTYFYRMRFLNVDCKNFSMLSYGDSFLNGEMKPVLEKNYKLV